MKNKERKKKNIPFVISTIIFITALIVFIGLLLKMHDEKKGYEKLAEKKNEPIVEDSTENENNKESPYLGYYLINDTVVQAEFKDLYLQNSDIAGWITIDDTPIDYPVMFTPKEEQFYIYKDFDKNYSSSGSIFIGAGASITRPSDNMILYGHHMANNTMFKPLDKYMDEEYYKEHKYITFDTLRQTGTYEIVAAFRTKIYYDEKDGFMYYTYTDLQKKEDFDKFVEECDKIKLYDTDATAEYGDQLITLSTCAYHTYNGRFVVVAKRIDGLKVDLDKEPIEVINTD